MNWLYLALVYLILAAVLYLATRDLRKGARWAGLIFFGGGLLLSLFNPSGLDFRLALTTCNICSMFQKVSSAYA